MHTSTFLIRIVFLLFLVITGFLSLEGRQTLPLIIKQLLEFLSSLVNRGARGVK